MADKKISQLPALQELDGNEDFAVAKEGANYKVSTKNLLKGNVRYDSTQELTVSEQLQARANIAAMANTPSGDPMHYMYEQAGAVWNAETGYWELNTLTDITTAEMRQIYAEAHFSKSMNDLSFFWQRSESRTNICHSIWYNATTLINAFRNCENIEVVSLTDKDFYANANNISYTFQGCLNLKKIIPSIHLASNSNITNAFVRCVELLDIRIRNLAQNINISDSPKLSVESVAFMINNSTATNSIAITVHHDAYVRFMADPTILAALEAHPLVTLADAGETA